MRRVRQVVFGVRNPERRVVDLACGVPDADREAATRIGIRRRDIRTPVTGLGRAGDAMGSAGRDVCRSGRDSGRVRRPVPAKPIRDGEPAGRPIGGGGAWTRVAIPGRRMRDHVRLLPGGDAGGGTMDRI